MLTGRVTIADTTDLRMGIPLIGAIRRLVPHLEDTITKTAGTVQLTIQIAVSILVVRSEVATSLWVYATA
jgi:hypothetical protein